MNAVAVAELATSPRFRVLPPLALYVHIPWCVRKCPYCDFNSHQVDGALDEQRYVDALLADLEFSLPSVWGRRVHTIFIGGGTPSLFSAKSIDALLAGIRARLAVIPDAEVTIEANPGTFEREKFAGFFAAGVNRLSLGVQSFDGDKLTALGRVHDSDEARRAAEAAMMIFGNVNLDLMFALPQQTLAQAESDIATALAFNTPHLSFYQLTLEPNTLFHAHPPALPDDELADDIQQHVATRLAAAGYRRYEVSAYARPGRECAHNLNYWRFGDYLGIGAGAHSKLSFADRIERAVRYKQPRQYMERVSAQDPVLQATRVTRDDVGFEFMLNALRLTDGVASSLFAERTGMPLALVAGTIAEASRRGLLESDPACLCPTPLGRRFLNDLTALFLKS